MTFILATILNVILGTVRGIVTVKGKPLYAAIISAISYGFYCFVIVYTTDDSLPIYYKALITAVANFIGVLVVKLIEKKIAPDKLWQLTCMFYTKDKDRIIEDLNKIDAHYKYTELGKHFEIVAYSESHSKSAEIAKIVKYYNGRYFISENAGRLI